MSTPTPPARLVSVVALDGRDESTLLALAAALARACEPAWAAVLLDSARERNLSIPDVDRVYQTTSGGIAAGVAGQTVVLGSAALFGDFGLCTENVGDWPDRLRRHGQHVLLMAIDGRTCGFLGVVNAPVAPPEDVMKPASDTFPTDTTNLPPAEPTGSIELADLARFDLRIAPVTKQVNGQTVRMLAYNGSIPGPTLRVRQGSTLVVDVVNDADLQTTVHWHGLRLENRYDGTALTQPPMPVGGKFSYRLAFPDPGVYWYHPHIREDYGQEMGLYGTIVVVPQDADYWPPVHREITLTLDDLLLEDGRIAAFSRSHPTFTAMGRFGNVLLVNGEPGLSLEARQDEVVRLYLTNTANTRIFNVAIPGARMKLVGGDGGRCEREAFVENVVIAPSERVIVDVLFDEPGRRVIEHRTAERIHPLATVDVSTQAAKPPLVAQFQILRVNADVAAMRPVVEGRLAAEPDETLALVAEMNVADPADARTEFVCPMHPEVRSARADRCPRCGMKLVPAAFAAAAAHGAHDHGDAAEGSGHGAGATSLSVPAGIEWEDDMVDVNRLTTPANMRWKLIDRRTGAEGASIKWRFRVGDLVKIRLVNEMDSDHPMHHPFHIHGSGRFLVMSRDGVVEPNLVWKDTVLVTTGQTVDILFEVTHPGVWMAHCHIAEHHESGMMLTFRADL